MDQVFPGRLVRGKGVPTRLVHRNCEMNQITQCLGVGWGVNETGEGCVCVRVCDRDRERDHKMSCTLG